MDIVEQRKAQQRKAGISARKGLKQDTAILYNRIISEKLLAMSHYRSVQTIFSYQAFNGEVDVTSFNEQAGRDGKRVAYPICHDGGKMIAAVPMDSEAWEVGKYGIRAPRENRSYIINPSEIDLVIVPCTAFDGLSRMRVGMGAGYYDRYLPQCHMAISIAVAYEVQSVHGQIAYDQWDVPLNGIVTELKWYLEQDFKMEK